MLLMCLSYHFEHLRFILECCHMIYFGPAIILVCTFSCPSDDISFLFFFYGFTLGSGTGVSIFTFLNYVFDQFSLVAVKCWLVIS